MGKWVCRNICYIDLCQCRSSNRGGSKHCSTVVMDASELARFNDLLSADDVPGFVRALEDALSKYNGNFQLVLKSLGNIVFSKVTWHMLTLFACSVTSL